MKKVLSPLFGAALFFAACGDENTTIVENTDVESVTSFKDLGECKSKTIGKLAYVSDSVKVFACTDDGWVSMNGADGRNGKNGSKGDDGTSCTVKAIDDGYKVLCDGDSVGVLLNGAKGSNGKSCTAKEVEDGIEVSCPGSDPVTIKNGNDGAAGKSCTAKKVSDGIQVTCPDSKPVTIKNGDKGENGQSCSTKEVTDGIEVTCPGYDPVTIKNGKAGTNGTSCNIASDENGVVVIKCGEGKNVKTTTLYKAMCGKNPYDPGKQFCTEGKVVPLCGEKDYNTKNQFCSNKVVYDFCENKEYDPALQFCVKDEDKLYDKCGGEEYDPATHICGTNGKPEKIAAKCGDVPYNPDEMLCDSRDNQLYKIVTIAPEGSDYSETWIAENMNYATENGSFCYGKTEKERTDNCAEFGRLYNWNVAKEKVCPDGWHLPNLTEWESLLNAVGSRDDYGWTYDNAGTALKSKTGWDPADGIENKDTYGFNALAGYYPECYNEEDSKICEFKKGHQAIFWSSTRCTEDEDCEYDYQENDIIDMYIILLWYERNEANKSYQGITDYFGDENFGWVRCVKDKVDEI